MAIFTIYGILPIGVVADVEATSKEEALLKAEHLSLPRVCHQCNGQKEIDSWELSDGLEGEVKVMEIEYENSNC